MNEQSKVEELLNIAPYEESIESEKAFTEALQEELIFHYENNERYKSFCDRKGFDPHNGILSIGDIPPVAVSVFKELGFNLNSVPNRRISSPFSLMPNTSGALSPTLIITFFLIYD